jgi:drug/metabolite transporter (DMT)-like permease
MLGFAGSAIGTAIFYVLVQRAGGLFASLVTYGIPFVALFWGVLDGERIGWITILSLLIILAGVFLANRPEKNKAA